MAIMSDELTALADRLSNEDPSSFLGRLIWYSMGDVRIPQPECARMLKDAGFVASPPPMPLDVDIFKRVCTATKRDKVPTDDANVFENYLLVPFSDDETVRRRVVRQRVDNKGRKLGHDELIDIVFDRKTSAIHTETIGFGMCRGLCAEMVNEITSEYAKWRGSLNTYAVREWIRKRVLTLGATMVRPGGGVYFLKESLVGEIDALEAFAAELDASPHGDCELHSLPLVDDRKQREMVQRAFEAETVGALNTLLQEVSELNRNKTPISQDKFTTLFRAYRGLLDKTQDYESLLEQKLARSTTSLEVFQDALLQLRSNIKESP